MILSSDFLAAQWIQAKGPTGYARAVYSNASTFISSGDTLYLGTRGGLFRSTDLGQSWHSIGLKGKSIQYVFKHGREIFVNYYHYNGSRMVFMLHKSTDEGETWTDVATTITRQHSGGYPMAMGYHRDSLLYLFTYNGGSNHNTAFERYASADRGMTWTHLANTLSGDPVYSFASSGDAIMVSTGNYIWRRQDNDSMWRITLSDFFANEDWTITRMGDMLLTTGDKVYQSHDGGVTWTQRKKGTRIYEHHVMLRDTLFGLPEGTRTTIYFSIDTGATWKPYYTSKSDMYHMAAAGGKLFAGTASRIYEVLPGGKGVRSCDSGLIATVPGLFYIDSLLYAGTDRMQRSSDGGETWSEFAGNLPNGNRVGVLAKLGDVFYVAGSELDRSTDDGRTWTKVTGDTGTAFQYIRSIRGDGRNLFVATGYEGLWISRDSGTTWGRAPGITRPIGSLYAASPLVLAVADRMTYRSTDYGYTWDSISTNLPESYGANNIAALGNGVLLLTNSSRGLLRSTNQGLTWDSVPLPSTYINQVVARGTKAIAATLTGVYESDETGTIWTPMGEGLNGRVLSVALGENVAFAGTNGEGVWRHATVTSAVPRSETRPAASRPRVWPNPAGAAAWVEFVIANEGIVRVEIIDLLGRRVELLGEGWHEAGTYRMELSMTRFASGLYRVRLTDDAGSSDVPLVIAR